MYKNVFKKLRNIFEFDFILHSRGPLLKIFMKEYGKYITSNYYIVGKHYNNIFGKIFDIVIRYPQLLKLTRSLKAGIITASGDFVIASMKYINTPTVLFLDDYEYKLAFELEKMTASCIVVPICIPIKGKKILKYSGFNQLAYLHPNYFTPVKSVLREYGLTQNNYVFIREVSNTTLNYSGLEEGLLSEVCPYLKDMGFEIVLSLENKDLKRQFEDYCVILNEPVSDIHSLLHYASLTIASGDSMSRESCLVGTPAIYTGKRDMAINRELIKKGCFFKVDEVSNVMQQVKEIIENDIKKETEYTIQKAIKNEWDDTTQVIIDVLLSKLYNDESLIEKYKMEE
jgi:predicted glycosyltransferase